MPFSHNFCITNSATCFEIGIFSRQSAFRAARPTFLLERAAGGAGSFQFVLAKWAFDEIIANRIATLTAHLVFAVGVGKGDANDLISGGKPFADQS